MATKKKITPLGNKGSETLDKRVQESEQPLPKKKEPVEPAINHYSETISPPYIPETMLPLHLPETHLEGYDEEVLKLAFNKFQIDLNPPELELVPRSNLDKIWTEIVKRNKNNIITQEITDPFKWSKYKPYSGGQSDVGSLFYLPKKKKNEQMYT